MEYARISAMICCKIVWMLPVVVMLDVGLLLESVWQNVEVEEFQFNSYVTSTFQMTNIHDSQFLVIVKLKLLWQRTVKVISGKKNLRCIFHA